MQTQQEVARVLSRDGNLTGTPSGAAHSCAMEGCRGRRISVRWPDGHRSFPCTKGLLPTGRLGEWRVV